MIVRFSANDAKLLSKSPVNTFLFPKSVVPKNYKINKNNVKLFYHKINYQSKWNIIIMAAEYWKIILIAKKNK